MLLAVPAERVVVCRPSRVGGRRAAERSGRRPGSHQVQSGLASGGVPVEVGIAGAYVQAEAANLSATTIPDGQWPIIAQLGSIP